VRRKRWRCASTVLADRFKKAKLLISARIGE
jgi:hypothetical protein